MLSKIETRWFLSECTDAMLGCVPSVDEAGIKCV